MPEYNIMRAVEHSKLPVKFKKQYPTVEALGDAGWWLQRKYDGCMGIAKMTMDGPCKMLSRTGEDYSRSCQPILDALYESACAYGPFDPFVVIGEVWMSPEVALFPAISGEFRRHQPSDRLEFVMNDLLPWDLTCDRPYCARYYDLIDLVDGNKLRLAETLYEGLWADAKGFALKWQGEGGYDGAILRDPNSHYTIGDVKKGEIVKVKPTLSLTLRVIGSEPGEGKHAGRMGALIVSYKGQPVKVGTGLTDSERSMEMKDLLVEVECLGVTKDGSLREPRFKGIRIDVLSPDA